MYLQLSSNAVLITFLLKPLKQLHSQDCFVKRKRRHTHAHAFVLDRKITMHTLFPIYLSSSSFACAHINFVLDRNGACSCLPPPPTSNLLFVSSLSGGKKRGSCIFFIVLRASFSLGKGVVFFGNSAVSQLKHCIYVQKSIWHFVTNPTHQTTILCLIASRALKIPSSS